MKVYEIINPSDAITFTASSDAVAAATVLFLANGSYGCASADGETVLPILRFGGGEEWIGANKAIVDLAGDPAGRISIAEALETTAVCSLADREALIAAVGDDPAALGRWNEARRTSMNDICASARRLAELFRRPHEAKEPKS